MRLFVAVELDDAVRQAAASVATALQEVLGKRRVDARWVPPENMHLTVRFIGHVADADASPIIAAVAAPVHVEPFTIALDRCGTFPASGPPRVIWIGLREGIEPLRAIAEEMDRRLGPFGFESERRPFSAHLTLARVKDVPRAAAREARQLALAHHVPAASCHATHGTLFESRLSPRGSRYEAIARIPFIASAS